MLSTTTTAHTYPFLTGGGQMGELTRNHNWAGTSLGTPDQWPLSLRTTVGIILHSAFPMFLFWGPDLLCFYNDAYRPSLGDNGKHPAVGKPGADVWPEIWDFIGPMIEQVMRSGEPTFFEDQLIPIHRNNQLENVYWTFSYSPAFDNDGQINGVFVTCVETTTAVLNRQQLEASATASRRLTDTVPAIIWTTQPDGYCTYLNKQWYDLTGQSPEEAEGFGWLDATHPDDKEMAGQLFVEANQRQTSFSALYRLRQADNQYRWCIDRGSPRFSLAGVYEGMVGTVVDVHDQKLAEEEQQKLAAIIEASHEFIGMIGPDSSMLYCNPAALAQLGWDRVDGRHMADCVYPADRPLAQTLVDELLATGRVSHEIRFVNTRTSEPFWIQWNGVTLNDPTSNRVVAMATVSPNITQRKQAEQALKESEARFQAAILAVEGIIWTNNATGEMTGEQPGWATLTGQTYDQYQGYGWTDAVHPDDAQPTVDAWQIAVRERRMFVFEHRVRQYDGTWSLFSIRAIPLLDVDGSIREWVGVHTDITHQRQAVRDLERSEQFSRSLFQSSPVANLVFVGDAMVIQTINEGMLTMLGRDDSIIGKPFMEAMPELIPTPLMDRLRHVLATGETFYQPEERIDLVRYGQPYTGYYNYIYSPLTDADNIRNGVIVTAIEVTPQVLARQKVEAAQADLLLTNQQLGLALTAGQLGAYELDLTTGNITATPLFMANYGQKPDAVFTMTDLLAAIVRDDRAGMQQKLTESIANRTVFQARYRVVWPDGTLHWIKAFGHPVYSADGQPIKLVGITRDITAQRMAREELEWQVQQRTRQLQESVHDLERSNQNLQQFAYVASHDLQEPLRKIQAFGDLLKNQYAAELGEGVDYLGRMQSAASRMSTLIRDLLIYSRISTQQETTEPVPLAAIVDTALADLELVIEETGAVVTVDALPTVPGDASQLGQLMQNLLSNALKFRRVGTLPHVQIMCRIVAATDLPPGAKPTRLAPDYYRIDVSDNGIGFDEKYTDRIFQVFQRLHGKSEFAGTGIGLAICQKIVANHGGSITATSQPGQGATFSIYLPQ